MFLSQSRREKHWVLWVSPVVGRRQREERSFVSMSRQQDASLMMEMSFMTVVWWMRTG